MNKKLSVLIVDDDPNIGDTLTDILDEKKVAGSTGVKGLLIDD